MVTTLRPSVLARRRWAFLGQCLGFGVELRALIGLRPREDLYVRDLNQAASPASSARTSFDGGPHGRGLRGEGVVPLCCEA